MLVVIGITGVSGSGKGYVCSFFKEYGIDSIDTDAIVHRLYSENKSCIAMLVSYFGERILDKNGCIDRTVLGPLVYTDSQAMDFLNKTVHRFTLECVDKSVEEYSLRNAKAIIIDAPLLFESGYNEKCNVIISVVSDLQKRVTRICERDGITAEKALIRIKNQNSDSFFEKNSDYIIYNNGEDVKAQVLSVLESLKLI